MILKLIICNNSFPLEIFCYNDYSFKKQMNYKEKGIDDYDEKEN